MLYIQRITISIINKAEIMKPQILITGATGTTSQYAIQHLVEKGIKVRAMVRTIDDRSKDLEDMGSLLHRHREEWTHLTVGRYQSRARLPSSGRASVLGFRIRKGWPGIPVETQ